MRTSLGQRLRSIAPVDDGDEARATSERSGIGDGDGAPGDGVAAGAARGDADRERRADRAFREREGERPDASADQDAPRHVVCVVVDSLRADAVDPSYAPFLDDLVAVAAISPSTWTFPAVTSLLSGTYPHRHGAMRTADGFENSVADVTPLPEPTDANLLPDVLAGAGYATYGAFGFVVPFLALEGHFATHRLYDDAPADDLLADHAEWLASHRDGRTFSYLHLADLHEPVDPPRDHRRTHDVDPTITDVESWRHEDVVESTPTVERYRDHRRRLYRAAIEHVDNRLAAHRRRVDDLAAGGGPAAAGGDVAYLVTADHGEGFWERAALHAERFADPRPAYCVGHGGAPWEPVVRVPLGVSGLGVDVPADRRTSLVDVAPTLAGGVGVDLDDCGDFGGDGGEGGDGASDSVDGVPLSEPVRDDRRVLVEGARYGYEKKATYGDGHKLVVSRGDDATLALSLPDEGTVDLPDAAEAALREALPPWPGREGDGGRGTAEDGVEGATGQDRTATGQDRTAAGGDRKVSDEVDARLERLGYR